ncbi:hypothetical protein N7535_000424 [Penicillium sp. DV-2018c]|nr:hypothetical protein N7461_006329 [Penicillium sp. DV-2018c]KAJ5581804.1 hypothetical protein N7535_000424 [Penicillium sp. DV-2018c]
MSRRLNSKEAQVLEKLQKQWDTYSAAKDKYEQREREYEAFLDEIRDPRPRDRITDQRQSKDFIPGSNVVGADT